MFSALLVLSLAAIVFAAPYDDNLNSYWLKWKKQYGKKYDQIEDDNLRRMIWEKNLKYINVHNLEYALGLHNYTMAMNNFGDMTHDEFVAKYTGKLQRNIIRNGITFLSPLNINDLPVHVDWREKGYVTEIKDQGNCGSCWAFSVTGSLEGQHKRKTGDLVSLSEQQLVDCSRAYGNLGCSGGFMDQAFKYIKDNKGIDTEDSYPYEAKDDNCHFKQGTIGATVTGLVDIPEMKEDELQKAVATVGPISVAIDAGNESFQFYSSGVYDEPDCSQTILDHAVLAIGYGNYDGQDYWLVKNSWGIGWGQHGYILMSRNKNNQCGIATMASYPTV